MIKKLKTSTISFIYFKTKNIFQNKYLIVCSLGQHAKTFLLKIKNALNQHKTEKVYSISNGYKKKPNLYLFFSSKTECKNTSQRN